MKDKLKVAGRIGAELGAAKAEIEVLREQVKVLQSDANSWQSGYDKGRHDGARHRKSEVEQLRQHKNEYMDAAEATRKALLADIESLRNGLKNARYRIEQGRVWSGMGWTLTGLHAHQQQKALDEIDAALSQQAEAAGFEWPKLDKPAKVGPVRFQVGVSTRSVIEAAQRRYEYDVTPEKEAERIARGRTSIDKFWQGVMAEPAPAQDEPIFGDEDHVSIPRGLIGAACSAIDKKRDAPKVLAELRRYTFGDLSRPAQTEQQPVSWQFYQDGGSAEDFAAEALREAIAQPAEVEGVGKWSQLKNLAEKATPGPWWVDSHGHRVSTEDGMQTVFIAADKMGPATRHPETGNLSHWPNDWDASYIVNASPDKILELIAALSAVTAERDRLQQFEAAYNEWHDKTEWVQKTAKANELGKHRADVLKDRIDQLQAEAAGVTVRG